jgi:hypothetical protein
LSNGLLLTSLVEDEMNGGGEDLIEDCEIGDDEFDGNDFSNILLSKFKLDFKY